MSDKYSKRSEDDDNGLDSKSGSVDDDEYEYDIFVGAATKPATTSDDAKDGGDSELFNANDDDTRLTRASEEVSSSAVNDAQEEEEDDETEVDENSTATNVSSRTKNKFKQNPTRLTDQIFSKTNADTPTDENTAIVQQEAAAAAAANEVDESQQRQLLDQLLASVDYAVVLAFMEKFAAHLSLKDYPVRALESHLVNTKAVHRRLVDFHCSLLKHLRVAGGKACKRDKWEQHLVKVFHSLPSHIVSYLNSRSEEDSFST